MDLLGDECWWYIYKYASPLLSRNQATHTHIRTHTYTHKQCGSSQDDFNSMGRGAWLCSPRLEVCLGCRGNVWTQWQNLTFTGTSTPRSSTHNPSASYSFVWTLQPHRSSLWSAWCTVSPWSAGTLHILSDILCVQTEKFQQCKDLTMKSDNLEKDPQGSTMFAGVAGLWGAVSLIWVPCQFLPPAHFFRTRLGLESVGI